ncbi:MAG: molybdopterin-containing oxidoreductase family protein [Calditrichia bacterium]
MSSKQFRTTCVMDCPDTCALDVTVDDGKITAIRGARGRHPDTAGFICTKVSRYHKRIYHPDRLKYPMRRVGEKGRGEFERISWDDAISEITERFRKISARWGGEAIFPYHYGGSNGLLADEFMDHLYFSRLGASRCMKTLCAAPTTAVASGMYGKMPGVAFEDYLKAKFILVWGANPKVSNIHLMPYLRKAKRAGAFVAVVDPRRNFSEDEVDMHLPVMPGGDLPLALGMINHWQRNHNLDHDFLKSHAENLDVLLRAASDWPVERAAAKSGVSEEMIAELADRYAEASPAVLRCGWGLERNKNGGQAVAAILAMPSLLGKFGVRGGGYTMSNGGAVSFDKSKVLGELDWNTREINQTRLGEALLPELKTPVKALFVYNCNPVATVPDQNAVVRGLMRQDLFTVVFEQVMTDTAPYADILLPAVTFLEQHELKRGYGSYTIGGMQLVIDAVGEAKPNEEVFAMLGRAMGWNDGAFALDTNALMKKSAAALTLPDGSSGSSELLSGGSQDVKFDGENPIQFKSVLPRTKNGKVNLAPDALGDAPYRFERIVSDEYPLALITPGNEKMISSSFGEFNYPELWMTMNSEDAASRNLTDGASVRVFNELGEVACKVKIKNTVRPGVVSMPKGAWKKSSLNGSTSTALCPSDTNVVGGGACYNDARVEVELLEK